MIRVDCPQCGADVPHGRAQLRLTCPSCGLRFGSPIFELLPPVDVQVRRDRKGVNGALVFLAGLGVIGAFSLGSFWPAFLLVALLGVFGFASWRSESGADAHPAVKVLLGIFAAAGVVILIGIAALLYLFVQCSLGNIRLG